MNLFSLLKKPIVLLLAYNPFALGMPTASTSSTGTGVVCALPPLERAPCYNPTTEQTDALWKLRNGYGEGEILYADHFNPNRVAQWAIDHENTHHQLTPENECNLMLCSNGNRLGPEMCTSYSLYKKGYKAAQAINGEVKPGWRSTLVTVDTPYKKKSELKAELCKPCPERARNATIPTTFECRRGTLSN